VAAQRDRPAERRLTTDGAKLARCDDDDIRFAHAIIVIDIIGERLCD